MSLIFDHIAELHSARSWGAVLDAGTGINSLRWLRTLPASELTAVTGAELMVRRMRDALGPSPAHERILTGNWADPAILAGEKFDTVVADYLIGAMDGFAPYFQEEMFTRLRALTAGRLYLVGLEPYVVDRPSTPAGDIVFRIGHLRDAVLLLSGQKPYREFPLAWVEVQLERAGFAVVATRRFPIRYRARFVNAQLDMCVHRLHLVPDDLRDALAAHVETLRAEALAMEAKLGGLRHGFDYVVAAEPRTIS
ncbi:MAG: class I SAM-dependent methyltransferase [Rhizobiaceae bacterium]|nr:class I SAM-dependent methyltransferase [Rhizobiaceae bacterium]